MNKIAFFLPSLAGGGAERVCVNLAAGFLARGLEVEFVLVKAEGPLLHAVPAGAKVIDLSSRRTLTAVLPLATYLRREKPYALIAAPDHANLVAVWGRILADSPTRVVITHHIHPTLSIHNTPKLQEKMYPTLLRAFQPWVDCMVAVSQGVANDLASLAHLPRESICVVYNPIVTQDLVDLTFAPINHPWFYEGEPPVILAAGRLVAQKDYPTLLKAFAVLRERRVARLIILGEGKERKKLQILIRELGIQDDVELPGFSGCPYAFMSRSRVFALSSAWEGFGNVLVEALACGTQVVSTDCPSGPAEILDYGTFGRLVAVGDYSALADAIEEALDHPMKVESLKERAHAFSVDAAVEGYSALLGLA